MVSLQSFQHFISPYNFQSIASKTGDENKEIHKLGNIFLYHQIFKLVIFCLVERIVIETVFP